ncbi:hypothetical protein IE53DRAFT_384229 [Violaceomyces palustris]|uniref:Uncharacterized protein n=1 Tax=Violaceomyces palustris TaxID=1673888 RepID=A0ACD0P5H0_9BASI|nr:hypothetical protein IE53DRAFT_384229 [Violaceomyces palustris]
MPAPQVELFSTSILSNHKVRSRHERFTSVLAIKKIPFIYHDLASDESAKSRWRRKARDPQIPGILVNNEWRGTFEEFEEAVEFGELEIFLGVSASDFVKAKDEAFPGASPSTEVSYLPFAPEGSGKRPEPTADEFLKSLGLEDLQVSEAEVDSLIKGIGSEPVLIESTKRFVPSAEAAVKPLRLARMGNAAANGPADSKNPASKPQSPRSPSDARYSVSQRSTKALAAEAAALTTVRKTSGALLREAVSQGKDLQTAMDQSNLKNVVGSEDVDELFAALGLGDATISEHEAQAFLSEGSIPQGMSSGGDRIGRSKSTADKIRDEIAAREVAQKAREKGYLGKSASHALKMVPCESQTSGAEADTERQDGVTGKVPLVEQWVGSVQKGIQISVNPSPGPSSSSANELVENVHEPQFASAQRAVPGHDQMLASEPNAVALEPSQWKKGESTSHECSGKTLSSPEGPRIQDSAEVSVDDPNSVQEAKRESKNAIEECAEDGVQDTSILDHSMHQGKHQPADVGAEIDVDEGGPNPAAHSIPLEGGLAKSPVARPDRLSEKQSRLAEDEEISPAADVDISGSLKVGKPSGTGQQPELPDGLGPPVSPMTSRSSQTSVISDSADAHKDYGRRGHPESPQERVISRKGMDFARPKESPALSSSPSSPQSPDALKKKKAISIKTLANLGKEKEKETNTVSPLPVRHHERTISQILRDADAAMMDEGEESQF